MCCVTWSSEISPVHVSPKIKLTFSFIVTGPALTWWAEVLRIPRLHHRDPCHCRLGLYKHLFLRCSLSESGRHAEMSPVPCRGHTYVYWLRISTELTANNQNQLSPLDTPVQCRPIWLQMSLSCSQYPMEQKQESYNPHNCERKKINVVLIH